MTSFIVRRKLDNKDLFSVSYDDQCTEIEIQSSFDTISAIDLAYALAQALPFNGLLSKTRQIKKEVVAYKKEEGSCGRLMVAKSLGNGRYKVTSMSSIRFAFTAKTHVIMNSTTGRILMTLEDAANFILAVKSMGLDSIDIEIGKCDLFSHSPVDLETCDIITDADLDPNTWAMLEK